MNIAIVTGASSGMGREFAKQLRGYVAVDEIWAIARRESALESLKDLAVNGHDLMALGFSGKAIGEMLNRLLENVLDEELPNEREPLLEYAENHRGETL